MVMMVVVMMVVVVVVMVRMVAVMIVVVIDGGYDGSGGALGFDSDPGDSGGEVSGDEDVGGGEVKFPSMQRVLQKQITSHPPLVLLMTKIW